MKSFLVNFYRHLAIFFWSHCPARLQLRVFRIKKALSSANYDDAMYAIFAMLSGATASPEIITLYKTDYELTTGSDLTALKSPVLM